MSSRTAVATRLALGAARFTVSHSESIAVDFVPGGTTPVSATVRDARGYSWTLTLPSQALTTRATVRLSPLSTVSGPPTLGLATGVQVSPSDLVFAEPATLSVRVPTGSPSVVDYYVASQDGAAIRFGDITSSGVRLFGSSAVFGATHAASSSTVTAALAAAVETVPHNTRAVLTPPVVPYSCDASTARYSPALESYVASIEQPTRESLLNLLAVVDTGALTGAFEAPASRASTIEARHAVGTLSNALVRQAKAAVATARGNDALYLPVAALVSSVQQLLVAAGEKADSDLAQTLSAWSTTLHTAHCLNTNKSSANSNS